MFNALEGTRDGCLLGEPFRRRPDLPGPARPRRPAVRSPDPTRPWYVRVLDSTNTFDFMYLWFRWGIQDGSLRCLEIVTKYGLDAQLRPSSPRPAQLGTAGPGPAGSQLGPPPARSYVRVSGSTN